MHRIDLNCDMGESFGAWALGTDEAILPFVSSANIACGFHAGDPAVMRRTVRAAQAHGVAVGAHPGLPDLAGFGRRAMAVTPDEVYDLVVYQVGALLGFVRAAAATPDSERSLSAASAARRAAGITESPESTQTAATSTPAATRLPPANAATLSETTASSAPRTTASPAGSAVPALPARPGAGAPGPARSGGLAHVKPHGALYNMAARDAALADAIAAAVRDVDPSLVLFGLSGSELVAAGERARLRTAAEAFADRNYQRDGSLVPRSRPDALVGAADEALRRVLRMLREGKVRSVEGEDVALRADTICIHGDGPHAVDLARALHDGLRAEGIVLAPPGAPVTAGG